MLLALKILNMLKKILKNKFACFHVGIFLIHFQVDLSK